jgi:hypothetical protein
LTEGNGTKRGRQIGHGRKIQIPLGVERVIQLGATIGGLAQGLAEGPQLVFVFAQQFHG